MGSSTGNGSAVWSMCDRLNHMRCKKIWMVDQRLIPASYVLSSSPAVGFGIFSNHLVPFQTVWHHQSHHLQAFPSCVMWSVWQRPVANSPYTMSLGTRPSFVWSWLNQQCWAAVGKRSTCSPLSTESTLGFWVEAVSKDLQSSQDYSDKDFSHKAQHVDMLMIIAVTFVFVQWWSWHCACPGVPCLLPCRDTGAH